MARKRKPRRRRNLGPILWLALVGNVAAGIWLSPLTSVRKLTVVGAPEWDRGRLVKIAQMYRDMPAAALQPREFESAVLAHSAAAEADFRRSLFGTGRLELRYRSPLARFEGRAGQYLSQEGEIFELPPNAEPEGLPAVRLHETALRPIWTLAGAWPAGPASQALRGAPPAFRSQEASLEVDSEGAMCLNSGQAARVMLGSADRLEEKLRTLEGLLKERPGLLENVKELNLVEPSRPAVVPRGGSSP